MADKSFGKIRGDMLIGDVVNRYPNAIEVFMRNNLHCIGCGVSFYESINDGAKAHGIDVKKLLKELNECV